MRWQEPQEPRDQTFSEPLLFADNLVSVRWTKSKKKKALAGHRLPGIKEGQGLAYS